MARQVQAGPASSLQRHSDPAEFLQLYEQGIEAANGDEKVMANWFPMALKEGARTGS